MLSTVCCRPQAQKKAIMQNLKSNLMLDYERDGVFMGGYSNLCAVLFIRGYIFCTVRESNDKGSFGGFIKIYTGKWHSFIITITTCFPL